MGAGRSDDAHPVDAELRRVHRVAEAQLERARRALAQALDGVGANQPAVFDDPDPVRHPLDLVELMGGEEHRPPGCGRLAQQMLELVLHQWVEPRGRLVEDEQLGFVHQCEHDADFLTVALRELRDLAVERQPEPLSEVPGAAGAG